MTAQPPPPPPPGAPGAPGAKPAPTGTLTAFGLLHVVAVVLGWLSSFLVLLALMVIPESMGMWIVMGDGLLRAVLVLIVLIACLGGVIAGIIVYVRLPSGPARTGSLLLVIGFLVASGALGIEVTGNATPQAVYSAIRVIRAVGLLVSVVLAVTGLVMLRRAPSARREVGSPRGPDTVR